MIVNRNRGVAALTVAGVAWGMSVPLSKVALAWLDPAWLTAVRFALAATVLLTLVRCRKNGWHRLRAAFSWQVLAWGALGYGGAVLVQNTGIERTSVTHAALLIGAGPVLIAVISALWRHAVARPLAWAGFAVSLAGVAAVVGGTVGAGGHGGGATGTGDLLVLTSTALIATMTVAQARLLRERDPFAVTAIQFAGAALVTLPFAACASGLPAAPPSAGSVLAVIALTVLATLLPFTFFAYGQRRLPAEVAGAFLNLEPLVGAAIGIVAFGDAFGPRQLLGGASIVAGIALSSLPALRRPEPIRLEPSHSEPCHPEPCHPEPCHPEPGARGHGLAWPLTCRRRSLAITPAWPSGASGGRPRSRTVPTSACLSRSARPGSNRRPPRRTSLSGS